MHTSFLSHARDRYFWLSILLGLACVLAYLFDEPVEPANGGTWLGYGLGTIGALLILWLAYLGRRKRDFASGWGSVRGWVSAHVYFGTMLLVIVTLHTGFQFGANIHTLAYLLMTLVIISGLYGVFAYVTYPAARNELKRSQNMDDLFVLVEEIDAQILQLIAKVPNDVAGVVKSAVERTTIGGGSLDQLFGRDHSTVLIDGKIEKNSGQSGVLEFLVSRASLAEGDNHRFFSELVEAFTARKRTLDIIRKDISLYAKVKVWLLFHVPLTFALLAALLAHVLSVFIYW